MRWTIYRNGEFWAEFDNSHDFLDGWNAAMDRYDAHRFSYRFEDEITRRRVNSVMAEYFNLASYGL